jgi:hypothetical protein
MNINMGLYELWRVAKHLILMDVSILNIYLPD